MKRKPKKSTVEHSGYGCYEVACGPCGEEYEVSICPDYCAACGEKFECEKVKESK